MAKKKKANILPGTILCNYAIGDLKYHNQICIPMKYVTKTRENIEHTHLPTKSFPRLYLIFFSRKENLFIM